MAKILVIDDEPGLRLIMSEMLAELGHSVREARNGREGLLAIIADPPDVVFCDIYMPEHEGFETIRYLSRHRATLPVVAMTGRDTLLLSMAQRLGAAACLRKPFGIAELASSLDQALHCCRCEVA